MLICFQTESFSCVGPRAINEDSIYPDINRDSNNLVNSSLFLVCDGVGGHSKGEIASDLICTQLPLYFKSGGIENSDIRIVKKAIEALEDKFDAYISSFPNSYGMGSTLTFLHLHSKGVTVAYVGDTRVYQIREGKIIFSTEDHSLVYAKYKNGLLKKEGMEYETNKNVILQAVQGSIINKVKPTIFTITNLKRDDVFFMCTDGTWESFTEDELENIIQKYWQSLPHLKENIVQQCQYRSSDNYSGIFIKLNEEYLNSLSLNEAENKRIEKENIESYQELVSLFQSAIQ